MRILVVDDERAFAVLLARQLQRLGHEAIVALNPGDALEMLEPDISGVITDIDMPGMTGVELARQIRERMGPIPIAFCTGSDPFADVARSAAKFGPVWPKARDLDMVRKLVLHINGAASDERN